MFETWEGFRVAWNTTINSPCKNQTREVVQIGAGVCYGAGARLRMQKERCTVAVLRKPQASRYEYELSALKTIVRGPFTAEAKSTSPSRHVATPDLQNSTRRLSTSAPPKWWPHWNGER